MSDQAPATVRVGSWTDPVARTGCTVILFDRLVPTFADVRGGAPGTRETDLLKQGSLVQRADAIVFAGGSAFGLDAASGVMLYLKELGRGFPTETMPVPIVPAAILYDLGVGAAEAPTAQFGVDACHAALPIAHMERGLVGAGSGATTRKLWGPTLGQRGGLGYGSCQVEATTVHAVAAVNAAGAIVDPITGQSAVGDVPTPPSRTDLLLNISTGRESTTLVSVIVEGAADLHSLPRLAVSAHDGMARAIRPCHTLVDGDFVFVSTLQTAELSPGETLAMSVATEVAVERAIIDAVTA